MLIKDEAKITSKVEKVLVGCPSLVLEMPKTAEKSVTESVINRFIILTTGLCRCVS